MKLGSRFWEKEDSGRAVWCVRGRRPKKNAQGLRKEDITHERERKSKSDPFVGDPTTPIAGP